MHKPQKSSVQRKSPQLHSSLHENDDDNYDVADLHSNDKYNNNVDGHDTHTDQSDHTDHYDDNKNKGLNFRMQARIQEFFRGG